MVGMEGRCALVLVVLCSVVLMLCVQRAGASYPSIVEFASPAPAGMIGEIAEMESEGQGMFMDENTRRMLLYRRSYISYQALSANRSPCPARSGRSYYTNNCASSGGRVQPYRRSCTQISRCARG